jgi:hypothetical protein
MLFYYILLCGLLLIVQEQIPWDSGNEVVNSVVKRFLKKINSEITLKYFRLLPLLNMEFLAGPGVLTAGAGAKITGVCTALPFFSLYTSICSKGYTFR